MTALVVANPPLHDLRVQSLSMANTSRVPAGRVRSGRRSVRVVHLTGLVFDALAAGDLETANAHSPVPLTAYFAGPDWRSVWRMRSEQARRDPESPGWVTGVILDERQ